MRLINIEDPSEESIVDILCDLTKCCYFFSAISQRIRIQIFKLTNQWIHRKQDWKLGLMSFYIYLPLLVV